MPDIEVSLLIVDDAPSIRMVLSQVLETNGYNVRSAEDGFSALAEIRREVPDLLISDLNMPGMSGFELLRMVRRKFPSIRAIAMSGAFSGDEVPSGVAADAFFQKGRGFGDLIKIMESLPLPKRWARQSDAVPSPIWISRYERNAAGENYATIECSECLGIFPKVLNGTINPVNETNCFYCGSPVRYAILQSDDRESLLPLSARSLFSNASASIHAETRAMRLIFERRRKEARNAQDNRA